MGTICILLGIICLIGCAAGGFLVSNSILSNSTYLSLLGMKAISSTQVYLIVVSICTVIGLLLCLNLVMHGLTYNKLCKTYALLKKKGK